MFDWYELKQAGDEKHSRFIKQAAQDRRQFAREPQNNSAVAGLGQLLTAIKRGVKGFGAGRDFDPSTAKPSSRVS